ncbi:MAG: LCP family protein [Clostridiaceae bacterium]|jgi:LCP family protein required for cell wall assembly|nr:LCP family protein [Clostridiaceae bacterium]
MKKKKHPVKKILLFSGLVIATAVVVFSITMALNMRPPEGNKTINRTGRVSNDIEVIIEDDIPPQTPKKQVYTFLVAGLDKTSVSTDVIMLVKLDITNKNINILNIPRDTMLDTERRSKKINASFSAGGVELFEEDVASLTGFYVNRYVIFDIKGVEKIINAIGGVWFDVHRNMNYEDPTQDLYIHLKKGYQHLDGEQAVDLARFRSYPEGDIERIAIQQKLLKALAKQALKTENILKIPELVALVCDNVDTDIDISEMLWLANEVKNFSFDDIHTDIVPGTADTIDRISYWLPYKDELLDLINSRYNPLDSPITEDDIKIVPYKANKGK